jgi:hypothetical protein
MNIETRTSDGDRDKSDGRKLTRHVEGMLNQFFEERPKGRLRTPDEAMAELDFFFDLTQRIAGPVSIELLPRRGDAIGFRRRLHLYAVNAYYRALYRTDSITGKKTARGATRLTREYLTTILKLANEGLSHRAIGRRLGQLDPGTKDRIRHQLKTATLRYAAPKPKNGAERNSAGKRAKLSKKTKRK